MRYTVVWMPVAVQRLAAVWTASPNRSGVTRASNDIDQLLTVDPETVGDLRFDTVRTAIVWPLGVEFEIDDGDSTVRVLSVWNAIADHPPLTGN
jgi:hypothetical protein